MRLRRWRNRSKNAGSGFPPPAFAFFAEACNKIASTGKAASIARLCLTPFRRLSVFPLLTRSRRLWISTRRGCASECKQGLLPPSVQRVRRKSESMSAAQERRSVSGTREAGATLFQSMRGTELPKHCGGVRAIFSEGFATMRRGAVSSRDAPEREFRDSGAFRERA